MFDKELVINILQQCLIALDKIIYRFEAINEPTDFTSSKKGMERLDSICMLLIALGENIKKVDKITSKTLFIQFPMIDWKGIMGLRDIISHHYFDIDAEEIFWVCNNELHNLSSTLQNILTNLEINN